jgi:aminopeptidase YwaD
MLPPLCKSQLAPVSRRILIPLLAAATAAASPAQGPAVAAADPAGYLASIKTLTAPDMEGRGNGTQGLTRAAEFIEARYQELGLAPAGTAGYLQPFSVTTGAQLVGANRLQEQIGGATRDLALNKDFIPFSFSSSSEANAAAVFVGYGITAGEFGYDDYAGIDVRGKIVVLLRFEPLGFVKLSGNPKMTVHADVVTKAVNARNHGARAVILLNGVLGEDEEDSLTPFGSVSGPESVGIPLVQVPNRIAEGWFSAAGKSLTAAEARFDATTRPASFAFPDSFKLTLSVNVQPTRATVNNVLAYLPGQTGEYIIVGAHYDHLGYGTQGSRSPEYIGKIHPGADDNASGTAGVLELARLLAPFKGRLRRGILFASFAGEELGGLGSLDWTKEPTRPLEQAAAMINMDMIGRIQEQTVYVGGVGTGSNFRTILAAAQGGSSLHLEPSDANYGASDQTSFVAREIPTLFFSSGLDSNYHTPSDTWDKINSPDAARFLDLLARMILRLDGATLKPAFAPLASAH